VMRLKLPAPSCNSAGKLSLSLALAGREKSGGWQAGSSAAIARRYCSTIAMDGLVPGFYAK
jgi:hypothetical protein